MKRKLLSAFISAGLAVAIFAGCGSSANNSITEKPAEEAKKESMAQKSEASEKETPNKKEKSFIYAVTSDPGNTLNVFTADDRISMMMAKLVATPLYSMNADGSLNYYIAESLDASKDGLTYTCKLKSGITWNDGTPVTADDVVFTYEQYIKQDEGGTLTIAGQPIAVSKTNETTVEFKLPAVSASIEENLCTPLIIPKHIFEGKEDITVSLIDEKLVGTGPYIFEEYKAGEYIRFSKNPSYMNGEAKIDTVILRIVENDDTAKLALQSGEIDAWIALASELNGLENFTITPYSEGRVAYLRLNRVSDNMQDPEYRQGIFYALDREEILTAAYLSMDYASVGYSFLPNNNAYYTENVEKYEQDIEKAKALTANGSKKLSLCYIGTDAAQSAQALVIQAKLKAVGIEVELNGVEQAAYMAAAYDNENKNYDMYLGGYIMTLDPDGFSGMFGTGQMINYASEKVDSLFAAGKTELDPAKRAEIYNELQMEISKEALFYPFGTNLRLLVTNSEIIGIKEAGLAPIYTFEDMSKLSR